MSTRQRAHKPASDTSIVSATNLPQMTHPFQSDISTNSQTPNIQEQPNAWAESWDLTKTQYSSPLKPSSLVLGQPLQAKLTMDEPNSKYEQEAACSAHTVVQQMHFTGTSGTPLRTLAQQPKPAVSISQNPLQAKKIQRTPEDVWNQVQTLPQVTQDDAKHILKTHFYSNWFLTQEYLLEPQKWAELDKPPNEAQQHSPVFKGLMKTLLKLRETETNSLLTDVRTELMQQDQFRGLSEKGVLDWGSAGSQSLTSDIDVNLKGAGSIPAVGLFNKLFKTKLGWALDAGTVYDVNVYAQDFMTPSAGGGKPFDKNAAENTITPVQEVEELNASDQTDSLGFEAFALNQDVWSLVKMRIYMSDSEWNTYKQEMLQNARGDGSDDGIAREIQTQAQLDDAEDYYQDYKENLEAKIHNIDQSSETIYQNMREALAQGNRYLSDHQQEASKKMIAANLIYEEKLKEVSKLRQELQNIRVLQETPFSEVQISYIKELGIKLKNALSEAIVYSNEAYFTQGAVHFAVIGQQIGGGKSKLMISDDEHLHAFREQVGDTLKVLGEYAKSPIDKAVLKAGKYIDRMAKSAIPLLEGNPPIDPPNGYHELAVLGDTAAKLKADKTKLEELQDKAPQDLNKEKKEPEQLEELRTTLPQRQEAFPAFVGSKFKTVPELRTTVIAVGKQIEKDFRQKQQQRNTPNNAAQAPKNQPQNQDPQLNRIQNNIQEADEEVGCFSGLISMLKNFFDFL